MGRLINLIHIINGMYQKELPSALDPLLLHMYWWGHSAVNCLHSDPSLWYSGLKYDFFSCARKWHFFRSSPYSQIGWEDLGFYLQLQESCLPPFCQRGLACSQGALHPSSVPCWSWGSHMILPGAKAGLSLSWLVAPTPQVLRLHWQLNKSHYDFLILWDALVLLLILWGIWRKQLWLPFIYLLYQLITENSPSICWHLFTLICPLQFAWYVSVCSYYFSPLPSCG